MDLQGDDFDYYDILNVTKESSLEDIKASYHKLIRQWHPDKNTTRSEDPEKPLSIAQRSTEGVDIPQELQRDSAFNKIHLAYTVLSDSAQRSLYDKYGSEGISLKKLVKKQMEQEVVETHTIEEVIQDEDTMKKNEELRRVEEEAEIERRIHLLLQKRRWDKFREYPIQIVTRFTFSGITSVFDDRISSVLRKRLFHIRGTTVSNSVEIALSRHTRLGYAYVNSMARSTFGTSRGAVHLSSELTDTIMSTVSVDCGDYLGYKSSTVSLKKMFSDHFWVTTLFSVDRYLTPTMRCIVHKSWADRHAFELAAFPRYVLTYGYNRKFAEDLKLNLQTAVAPDDVGTLVRIKTMSTTGSVVGTTCRFSMHSGLYLDGYIRQKFETEFLAKMKLECRLRFKMNSLHLILKMVLNNTHIDLPIELYTGNVDYCVFLGTATACTMMMVPVVFEMLHKMVTPQTPKLSQEPAVKSMRRTFYSNFPFFSYIGGWWDDGLKHDKYVNEYGKSGELMNKTAIWSEETLEMIVAREVRLAQQEGDALFNSAKNNYQKETANDGLSILFAVYGHPEAINRLEEFTSVDIFDNLVTVISPVESDTPKRLALRSARNFVYGTVTVEYILKQNNQIRLQKLFDRYIIDVTNVLMSRVTDSQLFISINSKKHLIGFADPCANIFNVEAELFICYRYNKKAYTTRLRDNDPILLPEEKRMQ